MCTFKVSKNPNVLNLQFKFCPPPPTFICVYALDHKSLVFSYFLDLTLFFKIGDAHAVVSETVNYRKYWFKSGMVLPMSTFAVAVGAWSIQDLSFHYTESHIPIRSVG